MTGPFKVLLAIAGLGAIVAAYRFVNGIGSVANLSNGYPWGVWIAIDVVVGTAIGCGGYAVGLLVYILNKGKYHPLVRPAVLTSLLGYGLAVIAVVIDLGRFWGLWKVPVYVWRWSHCRSSRWHSCAAVHDGADDRAVAGVVQKLRMGTASGTKRLAEGAPRHREELLLDPRAWTAAADDAQSSPRHDDAAGPKIHPLWFTPWLPCCFWSTAIIMGSPS
jgi:hypothetical protein